jgi:plastocyanin
MFDSLVRRALAAAAGGAFLAVAAGAVAQQQVAAAAAGSAEISIENFTFTPPALTVAPGTMVTWVNNDEEPHNVVNVGQATRVFRSGGLDGGDKYAFVFDKPGTYEYICSVHPQMHGSVVVK